MSLEIDRLLVERLDAMEADGPILDPIMPTEETWEELVAEATALGYEVRLVEYCECADTPGLLGAANGSIHYANRIIRIRECLDDPRRRQTLKHELDHARDPDNGEEIDRAWYELRTDALAAQLLDELEAG